MIRKTDSDHNSISSFSAWNEPFLTPKDAVEILDDVRSSPEMWHKFTCIKNTVHYHTRCLQDFDKDI